MVIDQPVMGSHVARAKKARDMSDIGRIQQSANRHREEQVSRYDTSKLLLLREKGALNKGNTTKRGSFLARPSAKEIDATKKNESSREHVN